ncbi:chorismate--pyruvate lyase family protein [Beggiatoa leptomitoformis]|uniref:DUF98 domain-containing protein n=1 Tax=Beggiatoa leptomitoformis TaxID=288004 RepID=A0A2N9YBF2_9GAMM|nr:chorismate pyruvate-lyase family protein [Beggiatoa leptomitoformis]ALG69299.2 DUF98 domain-containing protein [Beggiatoa leptomitoformis]AUI67795.1 DUF98 domain-containing protein [Beggiatoa leptomitoformis]
MCAEDWDNPERYLPSAYSERVTIMQDALTLTKLSPFQRILLITDGTLTELLEAYLQEPIIVIKLAETMLDSTEAIPALEINIGQKIIKRDILLQGKETGKNWLYAESVIVPDRLEASFREQLLGSKTPIGKLWLAHRLETFKEKLTFTAEPAGELADFFKVVTTDTLLSRTYRVFSQRLAIMMITEKFPQQFYL